MKAEFDFETKTVMLNSGYEMPINGLGTYSLHGDECINSVKSALSNGVRLIDTASAYGNEEEIGQAVREAIDEGIIQREDIFVTTKIYPGREMENPEQSIQACIDRLDIGYVDYGFIHCLDEEKDWQAYQEGGALAYLLELKKQRVVRHIGLSSHTPGLVTKVLDAGIVDQLMFSINPGYDYRHGDYANGSTEERMAMYRKCEADGVGISVMKPFSGGQLLDDKTSPFGKALTRYQCIQYALNKPGVLTVLPGIRSVEDVKNLLGFFETSAEEKDYSMIGTFTPREAVGSCVYCNHCQPCPAGLNVGLINKYYDLAVAGDSMAAGHYGNLEKKASDCVACGHCDRRCPFHVKQTSRMEKIAAYFGK